MKTDVKKAIEGLRNFIKEVDDQICKLIVFLDDHPQWIEAVKNKCKGDKELVVMSDIKEFRSFIHQNGCSRMFININLDGKNGIDLAEELKLYDRFGELYFVSEKRPSEENLKRIERMGAKFIQKKKVLEKIIYKEGCINGHTN